MTKNKNIQYFLVLLLVGMLFSACKTTHSTGKRPSKGDTDLIATNHRLTPFEAIQQVETAQPAFTRAFAKKMSVNVDFKGRQLDVKANCKIVSDSAIHISIQPFFGIELFKIEITPKQIIVVDKTNKTYYESNYGIFNNDLGLVVDYYGIQSILSNRMFIPGKRVVLKDDFKWENNAKMNKLELKAYSIRQEVALNLSLARIVEMLLATRTESNEMQVCYDNFMLFDGVLFPKKIAIDVKQGKSIGAFHFTVEEMEFDKSFPMQSINLERYSVGDINSFFKK